MDRRFFATVGAGAPTISLSSSVNLSRQMKLTKLTFALGIASVGLLSSCGTPGIPEPPSLELARPVD